MAVPLVTCITRLTRRHHEVMLQTIDLKPQKASSSSQGIRYRDVTFLQQVPLHLG
jgi:hypothetical protein